MKRMLLLLVTVLLACNQGQHEEQRINAGGENVTPVADSINRVAGVEECQDLDLRPRFEIDTSECSKLLNNFFQSSSFTWLEDQPKDSIYAMVNEVDDSMVTIKLEYHKNGDHFTAGWLSLDLRSGLLKDEMNQSDTLRSFSYDHKKLDALMNSCLFEDSE